MKRIRNYINTDYHFDKPTMLAIFSALLVFSSIYGFIYEVIFYYFNGGMEYVYWRGGCFGPWILIYGIGSILIYLMTYRFKKSPLKVLLLSGTVCGALEFLTGAAFYYLMDGKRNWDYNTEILNFGNINGFICLRSVLIFAFSGLVLIYIMVPVLFGIAQKVNKKVFLSVSYALAIIYILDNLYNSYIAPMFPSLPNAVSFYTKLGFHFMSF